jgi:circadian clock protein KaiC
MAIRRMQVVKYRGTSHGTNQYPFLINENGFSVFPVTELGLDYPVSRQRVSSGVDRLDDMLGGQGYYRKSSVLVSGTAGTGKSSLAASFVRAACARGEKALYLSFEEAEQQIIRNMQSIGLDLQAPVDQGLLKFKTVRATSYGPEMHLSMIIRLIESVDPKVVVVDPISNLINIGTQKETRELLTRLIDFLKMRGITSLFTDLTRAGTSLEATEAEISSLMDTWILLRDIEYNGERNKGLYILKSRGMDHSNQIREFVISQEGLQLKDVYIGPGGVFTGTARVVQEAKERAEGRARRQRIDRLRRGLERKEKALANKIQELKDDFDCEKDEIEQAIEQALGQLELSSQEQEQLARMRGQDKTGASDEH